MRAALQAWSARRSQRFADPIPPRPPRDVTALLAVEDESWNQEILANDPQAFRLTRAAAAKAIAAAVADGRAQAARCGAPCNAAEAAARLGVPVIVVPGDNRFGPLFQFAEYRSRPACITLFGSAMDRLRKIIAEHGLAETLGLSDPAPVYLAHELYHHLDTIAPVPIARQAPVTMFALGPVRVPSGLVSLGEIGAAAFAGAMTGLRCHPRVLDCLVVGDFAGVG